MKLTYKNGFLLRDVIVSSLIFFGIISLFLILITGVSNNYNRNDMVNQQFSDNFNKLNTLTGTNGQIDIVRTQVSGASDLYASMGANVASTLTGGLISASVIMVISLVLVSCLIVLVIANIISTVTRGRV